MNLLIGKLEKLYTKLSRDDASPPKRSAAYILRHNTAETVKQVTFFSMNNSSHLNLFQLENEIAQLQAKRMATSQAYCQSMRKKIEELYERCQIGDSERHLIDFGKMKILICFPFLFSNLNFC